MIELVLGSSLRDTFDGPLDVLVRLVRAGRYPAGQLPVAAICRQFLLYMQEAETMDVELGGEFFHAAAWLVYLKSRALLPQQAGEELAAAELERELLDHENMQATARLLAERLAEAGLSAGLAHLESSEPPEVPAPAPLTIADVIAYARRAVELERSRMENVSPLPPPDLYTVEAVLAEIERKQPRLNPAAGPRPPAGLLGLRSLRPKSRYCSACSNLLRAIVSCSTSPYPLGLFCCNVLGSGHGAEWRMYIRWYGNVATVP